MSKVSTKKKVSPKRAPHTGRRPKAHVIGPDVLCAQPMSPKKPRKTKKPRKIKIRKPPAIVPGPPIVLSAPASGSTVHAIASSFIKAKLVATRSMLKEEADMFKKLDISQTILFIGGMIFLFQNALGAAAWVLAIGTFVPMLIRRGVAKWRDELMP